MIYLISFCELAELDIFLIILQKTSRVSNLQFILALNDYKMRNWTLGCARKDLRLGNIAFRKPR